MIDALITGKMRGTATQKTSGSGKTYVIAKVRTPVGDQMDCFANVIAFDQAVGETLLALGDGEAVAIAGTLKPSAWLDKTGVARPSLDVTATAILTVYSVQKKRKAAGGDGQPQHKPAKHGKAANGQEGMNAWKALHRPADMTGLDDGQPLDFLK